MRDGDAGGARGGDGARQARHHLVVDTGGVERLGLLGAAPEDERIAALEAHDELARQAVLDEAGVGLRLRHRDLPGRLAGVDQQAVRARLERQLIAGQAVEDEHVGAAHEIEAADGDQPGIAGAGADEVDGHAAPSASSSAPPSCSRRSTMVSTSAWGSSPSAS